LCLTRDPVESLFIEYSYVGKHFSIDFYCRLFQPIDQGAVSHTELPGCSIAAHNPQCAKIPLFAATIPIGILACTHDCLFGNSVYIPSAGTIALRLIETFLMSRTRSYTTFDSWHGGLLLRVRKH